MTCGIYKIENLLNHKVKIIMFQTTPSENGVKVIVYQQQKQK